MRCISIILAFLEIDSSESIIIGIDASFSCAIKNRNTIIAADFNHCIHYFFRVTSFKVLAVPAGKEKDFRCRIFLD
jgi:hypothetical protein